MNSSTLAKLKELASEVLYEWLVSTDRSEEFATNFLKMNVDLRMLTKKEMRKIAALYGECVSKEMSKIKSALNDQQKKRITKKCLDKALKLFRQ